MTFFALDIDSGIVQGYDALDESHTYAMATHSMIAACSHAFGKARECSCFVGLGGTYSYQKYEVGFFSDYARFASASESATELTCKIQLRPTLYVQPTVHLIVSQLSHSGTSVYTIGMLRFGWAI